ncbi:MAG: hypothetical protein AKCLJLPJ_02444 [Fimbriimonadales bacterium]|nr:MAG: NarK/NasA family nitrate transporter [Armatimonadota bacterium]MBV6504324.1 hypothetical protein [Fimbriimonadales bacterium]MCE7900489.1 NarK/NasA family nitrate transporter [Armatimonadetes bacterium ATM1]MDL1928377.1 NarK/NasA family nitrate transporter [Fimbriimonadia bacterium ATM]MBC6969068.1 NarK/NasA family nitrate transporter [Armatimonadota bacterium]
MSERAVANRVLILNTIAFTVCFAVWTLYGVLISFFVNSRLIELDKAQIGWLIGIPILTGSIFRLPVGMMTDKYGGKPVYIGVMLFSAVGLVLTSFADTFTSLMICGLVFGVSGTSFAVGIAYTSVFFPKKSQGTALGVFGMGNAGSGVTSLGGPILLKYLTNGGENPEGWRQMPLIYAGALVVMAIIFALLSVQKKPEIASQKSYVEMLRPLRDMRVWRFGVYYFLVFGAFVALAQWLIPYYLNVYAMSLAGAGLMASIFSLPSGVIRALGGWVSDHYGARTTMYWVLSICAICFFLLVAPRMQITSPGEGVLADADGTVASVSANAVVVGNQTYTLKTKSDISVEQLDEKALVWPTFTGWQEPVVKQGDKVKRRQLLARGTTHLYFQANVWVFTGLVFIAGIAMGIGKAAVYRHIPDYFPNDVGTVGGLVGVIGGLGGFFCPIIFGYLLKATGLWTTCWLLLALISVICLVWMHIVVLRMTRGMKDPGKLDSGDARREDVLAAGS